MGSGTLKDNQEGDDETKEGIDRYFDLDIVVIIFFIFYWMEPIVLRLQLIYSLLFINCSSHDNMSYKIRSVVYLTCFIHHILFKELDKMFKTRVG